MFVQSTVDRGGDDKSFQNPTDVPHFASKHAIEQYLVEKAGDKLPWTILRPTAFMENFNSTFIGKMIGSAFRVGVDNDKKVQLIAVKDVGVFAARAFADPKEYAGKGIALAGDELSTKEIAAAWKAGTGKELPYTYDFVGKGMLWAIPDVGNMFRFFNTTGYGADIPKLKKTYPGLLNFEEFVAQEVSASEKK
jgi:uncharacterized protein YbjT (DUF2867 family)